MIGHEVVKCSCCNSINKSFGYMGKVLWVNKSFGYMGKALWVNKSFGYMGKALWVTNSRQCIFKCHDIIIRKFDHNIPACKY